MNRRKCAAIPLRKSCQVRQFVFQLLGYRAITSPIESVASSTVISKNAGAVHRAHDGLVLVPGLCACGDEQCHQCYDNEHRHSSLHNGLRQMNPGWNKVRQYATSLVGQGR